MPYTPQEVVMPYTPQEAMMTCTPHALFLYRKLSPSLLTYLGTSIRRIICREQTIDKFHFTVNIFEVILGTCVDHVATALVRPMLAVEFPALTIRLILQ